MSILMVTGIEGARNCADGVGAQLGMEVEVASGRKDALTALRKHEFLAVVMDETLAECDPAAADRICEHAGLAIPLQINFAVSGAARLVREIRAALRRQPLKPSSSPPSRACCCTRNWRSAAAKFRRRWPIVCAWLPIWPAACASS